MVCDELNCETQSSDVGNTFCLNSLTNGNFVSNYIRVKLIKEETEEELELSQDLCIVSRPRKTEWWLACRSCCCIYSDQLLQLIDTNAFAVWSCRRRRQLNALLPVELGYWEFGSTFISLDINNTSSR